MLIRNYRPEDWDQVATIYQAGIDTGMATFETSVKPQSSFERDAIEGLTFVAEVDGKVSGWATLWPVSDRCCYAGVAEVSVYIHPDCSGRGVGTKLLSHLASESGKHGIWTLQAGIFNINKGSIALHEKCGFRLVGIREKLGQLNGKWHDIAFMERRSKIL